MQDQELPNITQQAIAAAGGPTALAEALELTPSGVSQWGTANKIPQNRVIEVCRLTRGVFQPHQLRPDFFSEGVRV
jgi:DNA-binding transcriptional regulator YdaS (Cro superfamily)